VTPCSSGTFFN